MKLTEAQKETAMETMVPGEVGVYAIQVLNQDGSVARTIYVDLKTGKTEVEDGQA